MSPDSYEGMSDEELIGACAGSDEPAAWLEFQRRFHRTIAGAIIRIMGYRTPPDILENLVQETYLKLCAGDRKLLRTLVEQRAGGIRKYVKLTAESVASDERKRRKAEKRPDDEKAQTLEDWDTADPQLDEEAVHQRILLEQIRPLVTACAGTRDCARNCTIFWLRHLQGMTTAEIARLPEVKLGEKGVSTLLDRMFRCVRQKMAGGNGAAGDGEAAL